MASLRVERLTLSVDTRSKAADRSRIPYRESSGPTKCSPVEWQITVRSVLIAPHANESTEVLDSCSLRVHGYLGHVPAGINDTSITLKLGQLTVPCDDLDLISGLFAKVKDTGIEEETIVSGCSTPNVVGNDASDASSQQNGAHLSTPEARAFADKIVYGISEVQIALGYFTLSKRILSPSKSDHSIYLSMAMREIGVELSRLDQDGPAHRTYFSPEDVAHQISLTATSISAGVDYSGDITSRMFTIPMLTALVRTTVPATLITYSLCPSSDDVRQDSMLLVNLVCTSPSLDLDPQHLHLLLTCVRSVQRDNPSPPRHNFSRLKDYTLFSHMLPKAVVTIAVQEPVFRVSLPRHSHAIDYDMIIASIASITLTIDSYHDRESPSRYMVSLNYRQTKHELYGQTPSGARHDLLAAHTVELQVDLTALPRPSVSITGDYRTLEVFLVDTDICSGLKQIVDTVRQESSRFTGRTKSRSTLSFLRSLPSWVSYIHIKGSDFGIRVTDVDQAVSKYARGMAIQLASWALEYKIQRSEPSVRSSALGRSTSQSSSQKSETSPSPRKRLVNIGDGRRMTIHTQGISGAILDTIPDTKPETFLSVPAFEIAFSTSTDAHGPIYHMNAAAKTLSVHYSLYNHFAVGVAVLLLKRTFSVSSADHHVPESRELPTPKSSCEITEITTIDFRADSVHLKADMPEKPAMLLDLYGLESGKHRWATPFVRARTIRLCVTTPNLPKLWTRLVSIKAARVDLRTVKRRVNGRTIEERTVDVATDALRFGVPHTLIVHAVFDNIINVVKTAAQLHHHFATDSSEYILTKRPEKPKNVPRITLRSQILLFELEDDSFEYKLGTIYRTGVSEQRSRLAREAAFRLKSKLYQKPIPKKPAQVGSNPSIVEKNSLKGNFTFDPNGFCAMNGDVHRSPDKVKETLDRYNADSWKKRIDEAFMSRRHAIRDIRSYFWGMDNTEDDPVEPLVAMSQKPALACLFVSDLYIGIDKPSFPISELPKFMHDVGKSIPHDTKYGLLLPMHLHVNLGEARLLLRDYPLPLLHIPPIKSGQSPRLPSLSLHTDLVIGEEFRDKESQRHVNVTVVPESKLGPLDHSNRFAVDVARTISPVKTYSTMTIEINTAAPTRITWGSSYQPAIQDMMQRIEGFTKPAIDPSDRVGFWDKIRLSFHSRIKVSWPGDGDVHLNLKGSRDPYVVTGFGAGLMMVWRNNVIWQINQTDDPKRFMMVESGDYILAVPDFLDYARQNADVNAGKEAGKHQTKAGTSFKKVAMKLSGNVQWLGGLVFEHETSNGERGFDFKPHHQVVFKHPDHASSTGGEVYDAFRGFRSHHIHMSLAVAAPKSRDWEASNTQPSNNYNSVHLSPRFFTHFLNWWSLFSGAMSLPVRQGPLWTVQEKSSKKFGRHIATIKYNLLLSPVFLSHVYRHKAADARDPSDSSATGLKMKLDSLILDLHQRREYFSLPENKSTYPRRNTSMRINQCQLDFVSGDIRAISALFHGRTSDTSGDTKRFNIPDENHAWIDMDDYIDIHCVTGTISEAQILPLATAPRFTYYRQTDHDGETSSSSPFGDEDTHYCIMSDQNDPRRVQSEILQQRLDTVIEQITHNKRITGEHELKVIRDHTNDDKIEDRFHATQDFGQHLLRKKAFLEHMVSQLTGELGSSERSKSSHSHTTDGSVDHSIDFSNRFVVHNAQIKWNNALRNIILRYIHQVSQRRGFVYYMSRKAVKFILDIIKEKTVRRNSTVNSEMPSPEAEDEQTIQDRIEQILADGRAFVDANDSGQPQMAADKDVAADDEIATEFTAQNTYHFKLVAPQFQLQSDKNPKSAVLIALRSMQLKVVQIMDNDRIMDEISGLVQRRFNATVDCLQVFVTSPKTFSTEYLHMYSGNRYGTTSGSYWPPWVPVEVMYEFEIHPYGFSQVVQPTSASLRYDKFNSLRLKYNDGVSRGGTDPDSPESRMDHLWVEFPEVRAICDSLQYFAMYIIVVDLLLYSEPLEKTRSERLEKIMLASDFSDLTGAPEMVETLQRRINQLEEIKVQRQTSDGLYMSQSPSDGSVIDRDLNSYEDELFFMMEAITTSQRRLEDRGVQESSTGMVRRLVSARRIAWHLVKEKHESLLEFQLKDCLFDRTENNDGSNMNNIEVGLINGYNLLPNALYPQIIGPYSDEADPNIRMLRVNWLMLEAIAGIPVVDFFEVDLVPVKVQLERDIAKQIFEYIFPGVGENAFDGNGFSPFQIKHLLPVHPGEKNGDDEDMSVDADGGEYQAGGRREHGSGTGAGTLEQRLMPTLNLKDPKKRSGRKSGQATPEGNHWYSLGSRDRSNTQLLHKSGLNTPSELRSTPSEQSIVSSNLSVDAFATKTKSNWQAGKDKDRQKDDKEKRSDDLTQMVDRASNYMTLSVFKVHSLVLSLSYKGRGQRNLEDVHDLVFRMPALEYRNKTWSNLDLALQVKKDVVKTLISHTGAIIGNKFGHHRPSKQQQLRIREMAKTQIMMNVTHESPSNNLDVASARNSHGGSIGSASSNSDSTVSYMDSQGQPIVSPARSPRGSGKFTASPVPDRSEEGEHPPVSDSPRNGRPDAGSANDDSKLKGSVTDLGEAVNKRLTGLGRRLRGLSDATSTNTNASESQDGDSMRSKSRMASTRQKLLKRSSTTRNEL